MKLEIGFHLKKDNHYLILRFYMNIIDLKVSPIAIK